MTTLLRCCVPLSILYIRYLFLMIN